MFWKGVKKCSLSRSLTDCLTRMKTQGLNNREQVIITHQLMPTVVKYVQNDYKRRFTVIWLLGSNSASFVHKKKSIIEKT